MRNFEPVQIYLARALMALCEPMPLYDVFNAAGELLLTGVSHASAIAAIDAQQSRQQFAMRWQGELRIKLQRGRARNGGAV